MAPFIRLYQLAPEQCNTNWSTPDRYTCARALSFVGRFINALRKMCCFPEKILIRTSANHHFPPIKSTMSTLLIHDVIIIKMLRKKGKATQQDRKTNQHNTTRPRQVFSKKKLPHVHCILLLTYTFFQHTTPTDMCYRDMVKFIRDASEVEILCF